MNRFFLALIIWGVFVLVCLAGEYARAEKAHTCVDVRAIVAAVGRENAEAAARAAGATDQQIRDAKKCLTSSSR